MTLGSSMRSSWKGILRAARRVCSGRSLFVFITVSLISAACGAVSGYLLGCIVVEQRAEMIADQFDLRVQSVVNASIQEAQRALEDLKRSPYPYCSDDDLAWMRMQVFRMDYLNEVARMHAGQMLCSATLGRAAPEHSTYTPILLQDQMRVYLNPSPFQRPHVNLVGVQKGDILVLFRPTFQSFFGSAPFHLAVTVRNAQGGILSPVLGNTENAPPWVLTQQKTTRWKSTVFATRCNADGRLCITSSIPFAQAMKYGASGVTLTTVFGGVLGALLPLLASFFSSHRRVMEWQLRQAIRDDALQVLYMPVVDLCSRRVRGAEALVRWRGEDGRQIPPDIFVRLAEERGFIGELTELVVRHVLQELGDHLRADSELLISMNATATDFADPAFLPMLDRSLAKANVTPESLIIEITESSTARHDVVRDTIRQLRERGFQVFIDDFGTGYSSLAYLHELSVDAIKIDRSFTQAIDSKPVADTILPQIMSMADALHLDVIVEGIETEEHAAYFTDLEKPRMAQGWLFGPPAPAADFLELYMQQDAYAATTASS